MNVVIMYISIRISIIRIISIVLAEVDQNATREARRARPTGMIQIFRCPLIRISYDYPIIWPFDSYNMHKPGTYNGGA